MPAFSKQRKQHSRHLHRNSRRIITLRQRFRSRKMYRARLCNLHASARKIFVPVQNHARRKARQRPHRRNKDNVRSLKKQ